MAADAYPDSSFLISLLRADSNAEAAARHLAASNETLAFTPLHRVEVRNPLRNAARCRCPRVRGHRFPVV